MQAEEILQTIAEVSIAFAGFSGLITVFQNQDRVTWRPVDALRFWFMIEWSLWCLLYSLMPFVAGALMSASTTPWASCTKLIGFHLVIQSVVMSIRSLRLPPDERSPKWPFTAAFVLGGSFLLGAFILAAGFSVAPVAPSGAYLLGLTWMLVAAAYQFIRLLAAGAPHIE